MHESSLMLPADLGLTSSNQVTKMLRKSTPLCILTSFVIITVTGCGKNSGEALVLAKEHIDAALPSAEIPKAQSESGPNVEIRRMSDDEIEVDGYVMKAEERGTDHDPRALKEERWLVKVRTLADGRTFHVETDQPKWEKLRENDRVKVRYHTGKYTGTVWAAEIE